MLGVSKLNREIVEMNTLFIKRTTALKLVIRSLSILSYHKQLLCYYISSLIYMYIYCQDIVDVCIRASPRRRRYPLVHSDTSFSFDNKMEHLFPFISRSECQTEKKLGDLR